MAIERAIAAETLVMENDREVYNAMVALQEERGAFADALIGELGAFAGCSHTLTFDRAAARLSGFKLA